MAEQPFHRMHNRGNLRANHGNRSRNERDNCGGHYFTLTNTLPSGAVTCCTNSATELLKGLAATAPPCRDSSPISPPSSIFADGFRLMTGPGSGAHTGC